jgi:hypothetical protein
VAIEDLRQPPFKARIEFYKILTSPRSHRTETWVLDSQCRLHLSRPGPQRDAAHQSARADYHLFPRGPGLPRLAAMISVLIYSLSLASQRDSSPAQSLRPAVRRFCPFIVFRHTSPRLFPVSPQAPRREHQAAPSGTAGFCFPGLLPKASMGPLSQKAALGTWEQPSLTSVPAECPE